MNGYVRQRSAPYNPGCLLPTNVAGYEEAPSFEGYVPPNTVNAKCGQFTPQPANPNLPEGFRPLF
jgi:hypothetical protein